MKIEMELEDSATLFRFWDNCVVTPQVLGLIGSIIGSESELGKRLDVIWAEWEVERIAAEGGDKRYARGDTQIDNWSMDATGFYINASAYRWSGDCNNFEDVFLSFEDFLDPDFVAKQRATRLAAEAAEKEKRRVKRAEAKVRKAERAAEKAVQDELEERAEYRRLSIKYHALT